MTQRWTPEQANAWYAQQPWLVGCNFIPSNAVNQLEMWQAETFDPVTIDRETGWAAALGMNTLRVFLHDLAWQQDAKGFKQRIDQFLSIASKHGIRTLFVLFDDCWNSDPKAGKQPEPIPGRHNAGWLQSPGFRAATDPAQEPRLKAYVQDIVSTFGKDERVIAWDVYNELGNTFLLTTAEPFYTKYPKLFYKGFMHLLMPLPTLPLLLKAMQWIRETDPMQPLTAGIWFFRRSLNQTLIEQSDIISFHNYFRAPNLERQIKKLQACGRPLLCTEYMSRTSGSLFETHLPVFKKYKVGCYNWGLVCGKTQTHYGWADHGSSAEPDPWFHDMLKRDGSPYAEKEVQFIREITKTSS